MEPRLVLSGSTAPPIYVGAVYTELTTFLAGEQEGDSFELTWTGGATGTQLKHLVISGDQNGDGVLDDGDVFFDPDSSGPGSGAPFPFTIISQTGIDSVTHSVSADGLTLTLDITGWDPGEKLLFTIDVDEQDRTANSLVEGGEFEGAILTTTFVDANGHNLDATGSGIFLDNYDATIPSDIVKSSSRPWGLPLDSHLPQNDGGSIRTAGIGYTVQQETAPFTISGAVYHDLNLNNVQENGELGIAGVNLSLYMLQNNQYVDTGLRATTASDGSYSFTNNCAGSYRVVETQPAGWVSVGSSSPTGVLTSSDVISDLVMLGGDASVNNDFSEARPMSLSGNVYHDVNDNGLFDDGATGISGVRIEVQRETGVGQPPAAPIVTFTLGDGSWSVSGLIPGSYTVHEFQPSPWLDGKDSLGSLSGVYTTNDVFQQISFTQSGQAGVNYNFGELHTATLSGQVFTDLNDSITLEPNLGEIPLAGVTIYLLDANGVRTGVSQVTGADGRYTFTGLVPGVVYGVEEVQPAAYFDGLEKPGDAGGSVTSNDKITGIVLASAQDATGYDFGEHPPATLSGRVFTDLNDNIALDPGSGEVPLAGVTIYLLDSTGARIPGQTQVTDADGRYTFTNLEPGKTYGVEEEQPAGFYDGLEKPGDAGGAVTSNDKITGIVLTPAQNSTGYDFGEHPPATLSGQVFTDLNDDIALNANSGEIPLAGVTVHLLDANGARTGVFKTTDANGHYTFTNLEPGKVYGVEEVQPAAYFDGLEKPGTAGGSVTSNDKITGVVLAPGQNATGYDFGEHPPATLSGQVFTDLNDDIALNANSGEIPLAGVTFYLLDANGARIPGQTQVTGNDGRYTFTSLNPGVVYGVEEVQPAAYYDGLEKAGTAGGAVTSNDKITGIVLSPAQNATGYDFGEHPPASFTGFVYGDLNNNGSMEGNEPGISGVLMELLDANGNPTGVTTTTDANGQYKFDNLAPGTYGVRQVAQPAGYFDGLDSPGNAGGTAQNPGDMITGLTVNPGQQASGYKFGEIPPASISGRVYRDNNNNGLIDSGENGIGQVQLELLVGGQPTGITTVTAADGTYLFLGLEPLKTYGVRETQPSGYYDGLDTPGTAGGQAQNPGDQITGVFLNVNQQAIHYNFGELQPSNLTGFVYGDLNNNGNMEGNEPGIAGVLIELLDANGNSTGLTTTTDANGQYAFLGIQPGTYQVRETQPAGYYDGLDSAGSVGGVAHNPGDLITDINIGAGVTADSYKFGELVPSTLTGFVYGDLNNNGNMEGNEPGIAGVLIELLDANGNSTGLTTQTDANGQYAFVDIQPGTYQVRETQPAGYYDGLDSAGSVGGVAHNPGDLITDINIAPGVTANSYKFGELVPSTLTGFVYGDLNNNGNMEGNEPGIAGVLIELLDANGNTTGLTTTTDANGQYAFVDILPGTYQVRETQPAGYYDGLDSAGSVGGVAHNPGDLITDINIGPGVTANSYKFGELVPSTLTGFVYGDLNNNGNMEGNEPGIAGVSIELLDAYGNSTGLTTITDANGQYAFYGIKPGTYQVRETQPTGYYDGLDSAGSAGGIAHNPGDLISNISLGAGVTATSYKFGELLPSSISGYVFQDGPTIQVQQGQDPTPAMAARDGLRTADDRPLAGVTMYLGDAAGNLIRGPGGAPVATVTDANGFYQFAGLAPGVYSVFEAQQPAGLFDGLDTPGSTGGVAANPGAEGNPALIGVAHHHDAIVQIVAPTGGVSVENNFSELDVHAQIVFLPLAPDAPNLLLGPLPTLPGGVGAPGVLPPTVSGGGSGPRVYGAGGAAPALTTAVSWHLSIIDAGRPRGDGGRSDALVQIAMPAQGDIFVSAKSMLNDAQWVLYRGDAGEPNDSVVFGSPQGIPVSGDFNGDGVAEVGVFVNGFWYLDLNGNGVWDESDLWAKLGARRDRPVTGDWDGDGKDDIGIFGPEWRNDTRAVMSEPGLPDRQNETYGAKKNIPPKPNEAPDGRRLMRRTSVGQVRSDLIDHVFYYGGDSDIPVAGDWNGDGVDTIGIFQGGTWTLDDNGDGKWLPGETLVQFGQPGDIPVVGDFDGDGVDDIGVFRDGKWIIDANGDRAFNEHDRVFELGGAGDYPVVGDWDGDGTDDPGIYRPGGVIERPPQ